LNAPGGPGCPDRGLSPTATSSLPASSTSMRARRCAPRSGCLTRGAVGLFLGSLPALSRSLWAGLTRAHLVIRSIRCRAGLEGAGSGGEDRQIVKHSKVRGGKVGLPDGGLLAADSSVRLVGRGCPDGIGVESDTCFCARRCAPGTRAVGARGKEWLGRRTRIGPKD
jgi:hypothetical protein